MLIIPSVQELLSETQYKQIWMIWHHVYQKYGSINYIGTCKCVCLESIEESGKTPENGNCDFQKMEPRGRGLFICIPLYHSSSFPLGRARFSSSVSARSSPALRRRRRRTVAAAWGPGAQAGAGRFQLSEAPPWHSLEERHEGCSDRCLPMRPHR